MAIEVIAILDRDIAIINNKIIIRIYIPIKNKTLQKITRTRNTDPQLMINYSFQEIHLNIVSLEVLLPLDKIGTKATKKKTSSHLPGSKENMNNPIKRTFQILNLTIGKEE